MKLPNGYGSVYKLSGKRRNPWAVRKTVGWSFNEEKQKSYPKYEFIGYYHTRQAALQALAEYNKNPYQINAENVTLEELYEMWSERHFDRISESNVRANQSAWKICAPIKDMEVNDIKLIHLQTMIDGSGKNKPILNKLKIMLGQMYDYGVKNEIIQKDKREIIRYIDLTGTENPDKVTRKPFSKEEIQTLWDHVWEKPVYSIVLILIYTGLRIGELIDLKKNAVYLDQQYMEIIQAKTEAGIRDVPIADKIMPLIKYWMDKNDSDYLVSSIYGNQLVYTKFRLKHWQKLNDLLGIYHTPHDTRHTFISLMTEAGVDNRIIKKIVGHKGSDITEKIYTHIDRKYKLEAVNKI